MPNHTLTECASPQGYESCTEGDAFIMSFADPLTALHFCMDVQRDLLRAAWPSEVVGVGGHSLDLRPILAVFQPSFPTEDQGLTYLCCQLNLPLVLNIAAPPHARRPLRRRGPNRIIGSCRGKRSSGPHP